MEGNEGILGMEGKTGIEEGKGGKASFGIEGMDGIAGNGGKVVGIFGTGGSFGCAGFGKLVTGGIAGATASVCEPRRWRALKHLSMLRKSTNSVKMIIDLEAMVARMLTVREEKMRECNLNGFDEGKEWFDWLFIMLKMDGK
ncbi:hypothetical protein MA16_Dca004431 [Dendrobium catenatum]|uniref:Uncharacterized protein n=1 Tax=Dendrobium catenatum TaxID=906689 RepID=A0A2I0W7F2_9ASPA|nr:hypothetical protein MA16_Dca004431 [Dendrobium catenatum]